VRTVSLFAAWLTWFLTGPASENRVKRKVGDDFEDFKS
jgi:hypothetical protein